MQWLTSRNPLEQSGLSAFASQCPMKTILYLEDDEHDIFFLQRALSAQAPDLGFYHVSNLADATAYLEGAGRYSDRKRFHFPDLILSDVSIPGGSGFQFARWIRQHPNFMSLPIILLTGAAQETELQKAAISGADCCLEKSTDFSLLLRKIRECLARAESQKIYPN